MAASRRAAVSVRRVPSPLEDACAASERGEHARVLDLLRTVRPERREDRVTVALLQGRALLVMNRAADAVVPLRRAVKDAKGSAESARATMLLGAALARTNRRAEGETLLASVAAAAQRGAGDLPAEVAYHRALIRWSAFELADAETIVDEALPAAAGVGRARLLQLLGWIDVRRESYGAATRSFTAALDVLSGVRDPDAALFAETLHGMAIIAAETIDLRLGRTVRRAYEAASWPDEMRTARFHVLDYLAWLSLLEGDVTRAWDERQLALTLTADTSLHAIALLDAAAVAGTVGDHFAERRYLEVAGALLLRGDQVNLTVEQRIALTYFAWFTPAANAATARTALTLYERTRPRGGALLALEGDRRLAAFEQQARGKVLLAEGKAREGIAELERALDVWTRLGYRLRAALTANALRWATGEARFTDLALDALRTAPNAWLRDSLVRRTTDDDPLAQLTPAERRVLDELMKGKRSREIADTFGRSFNTINNHTRAIFTAFGVRSRAALVAKCARLGILRGSAPPA